MGRDAGGERLMVAHWLRMGLLVVAVAVGLYTCATAKVDPGVLGFVIGYTVGQSH